MPDQPVEKKTISTLLGFDFGLRKIGVAVGQTLTGQATPLCLVRAADGIPDWDAVERLVAEWMPDALVVGLPVQNDGSDQLMTHCARKFVNRLKHRTRLPVYMEDERLTTRTARDTHGKEDTPVDDWAAKLILEAWMQRQLQS